MHLGRNSILGIAVVALLALGLAACGGGDDNSDDSGSAGGMGAGNGGQTVGTESVSGVGDVLVDSSGMALYTNDVDTRSKIACTDQCAAEWLPLAAPNGGEPTSDDSAIQGKLGTMQRSDGSSQVTFDGLPLYTFVDDSPGQVTGDGFSDSFAGTTFTWTVAAAGAVGSSAGTTTSDSDDDAGTGAGGY
jgi:predicted lipoprotein with Yx(FWY)xxD motif